MNKILLAYALVLFVSTTRANIEVVVSPDQLPRVAHMTMAVKTRNPSNELYSLIRQEGETFDGKPLEEQVAMLRLMYLLVKDAPELEGSISLGLNEPKVTRDPSTYAVSRCIRINNITDDNKVQWEAVLERCSELVVYSQSANNDFDIDYFLSELLAIAKMADAIEN